VLSPVQGGPSEKAGLLQGDRIIKVDDRVIAGNKTPQDSMIRLMKGPKGIKVKITVNRDGVLIPFDIVRDKIPVHCVDAAFMIDETTGYIKLSKFTRTTYKEFTEAAGKLMEQGMKRLIFDLRDNTGGYFDQSWRLANEFLGRGQLVVYMEGRNRPRDEFDADGRGKLQDIELSVLINEGSASSSEIFAGAIQDNDRGVIVGRRSFGKGLVQEPVNFTDGSGIRITVARFYTPSGRCIQKPYDENYDYDIYERYAHGEMTSADSMKIDTSAVYYTLKGRHVYGGGGIIPDIFVPMDTTKATTFYVNCNRKATSVRFAQTMFDKYRGALSSINDFAVLDTYLDGIDLASQFLDYAARVDGIKPEKGEWEKSSEYMMPQLKALVGRFSKLGDEAFHRYYIPIDDTIQSALENSSVID
jgi:carboxyl-terminal processing protease